MGGGHAVGQADWPIRSVIMATSEHPCREDHSRRGMDDLGPQSSQVRLGFLLRGSSPTKAVQDLRRVEAADGRTWSSEDRKDLVGRRLVSENGEQRVSVQENFNQSGAPRLVAAPPAWCWWTAPVNRAGLGPECG